MQKDNIQSRITEETIRKTKVMLTNRHWSLAVLVNKIHKSDDLEIEGLQPNDNLDIVSTIGFKKKLPN